MDSSNSILFYTKLAIKNKIDHFNCYKRIMYSPKKLNVHFDIISVFILT